MSDPTQPRRGKQWHRSYEAQLTEPERHALHAALLARTPTDVELCRQLPPWRKGPWKDQQVRSNTLSNIRDRLELEEDMRATEETTDLILAAVKTDTAGLTPEQLEAFGQRIFTTLAIQRRDPKTFVALRRQRLQAQALQLNREKFEELKRHQAEAAEQTATDPALSPSEKAERYRQIFGLA
ncbi:MAG TPA: hypothetical protein VMB21_16505 [Candidatus Limnocylindria bacterium]|nr:hypothetical protein [Candidatus Limnocylindria bacterium]